MGLAEDFRTSIYEEHLDEASFLYEQRNRYLEDPEVTFDDIAALEARLEAHIDGLVLGGSQALALCAKRAVGDDFGVQHAALRVFCRCDGRTAAHGTLAAIVEGGDPAALKAASDALSAELPASWSEFAADALREADPRLLSIWARAIGYRRMKLLDPLLAAVARTAEVPLSCAWALGELRDKRAEPALLGLLWRGEPDLARTAAIALLKCGSSVGAGEIEVLGAQSSPWLAVPLALGERPRYERIEFLARHAGEQPPLDAVLALGLLGDARAIPALLERLPDDDVGDAAAAALLLLTGAELTEVAEVEPAQDEPIDDDLVTPDDSPEGDETPVRKTTVFRLCRDPLRWKEWLAPRQEELDAVGRMRMGGPLSAATTAAALMRTALPLRLREWLSDELAIRFGVEFTYRPDMPTSIQRALLQTLSAAPARAARPLHAGA